MAVPLKPLLVFSDEWAHELKTAQSHIRRITEQRAKAVQEKVPFVLETEPLPYLHARLDIIDNKIGNLLTFNTILLAVAALSVPDSTNSSSTVLDAARRTPQSSLMIVAVTAWLVSTLLCLRESFIVWQRLTFDASNIESYAYRLLKVTLRRTANYNHATAAVWITLPALLAAQFARRDVPITLFGLSVGYAAVVYALVGVVVLAAVVLRFKHWIQVPKVEAPDPATSGRAAGRRRSLRSVVRAAKALGRCVGSIHISRRTTISQPVSHARAQHEPRGEPSCPFRPIDPDVAPA